MSKPAVRLGDATAHGGAVTAGSPNVFINGQPAARQGDLHVCPLLGPGTPPPPHVGGPVASGSTTVLINGQPAARVGDLAACAGPPDAIAMGSPSVVIGSGATPGTRTPASGSSPSAPADARASAAVAQQGTPEDARRAGHWIEFAFVDAAGRPVNRVPYRLTTPSGTAHASRLRADGVVRRSALPAAGRGAVVLRSVHAAAWSKAEARVGEAVRAAAVAAGYEEGTPAEVLIYRRGETDDALVEAIAAEVRGRKVEATWTYERPNPRAPGKMRRPKERSAPPTYVAEVRVHSQTARTGPLAFRDRIEVTVVDRYGEPVKNARYRLQLASGEVRTGRADTEGKVREAEVGPGRYRFLEVRRPAT